MDDGPKMITDREDELIREGGWEDIPCPRGEPLSNDSGWWFPITTDPADAPWDQEPYTRGDCATMPRPCPFATCKWHLAHADYMHQSQYRLRVVNEDPSTMADTCALDVAEEGGLSQEELGSVMGLSRARIHQVESLAIQQIGPGMALIADEPRYVVPKKRKYRPKATSIPWARDYLREHGYVHGDDFAAAANAEGYGWPTIRAYAKKIGYEKIRDGRQWIFYMPD